MPARKKSQNTSKKKCSPKTAMVKPPTQGEMVSQVVKWILEGQAESDIREAIGEMFPGVAPAELFTGAMNDFAKSANVDRDIAIGFCFRAVQDLYRRMVAIADYAAALRAIKQLLEMAEKYGETPSDV